MPRASAAGTLFKSREQETRTFLDPDEFAIVRLDGRAFHSYCRGLKRPYDEQLMADMDAVAVALRNQVDGVRLAFVQSDEISLLLSSWSPRPEGPDARQEYMYSGSVQKITSITAGIASAEMNIRRHGTITNKVAVFDSRAFTVRSRQEAVDYFIWRQQDAMINSLSMLAESEFSHWELHGVTSAQRWAKLLEIGVDPEELPAGFRRGRMVITQPEDRTVTFTRRGSEPETIDFQRQVAVAVPAVRFDEDDSLIPPALNAQVAA